MLLKSPKTSWFSEEYSPKIAGSAYVSATASVIGPVTVGENVMVSPGVSLRGDEGGKIYVGDNTNVQDNVVMHGLKEQIVTVNDTNYSIYVSDHVSCAHACIIHGPAFVGHHSFIGFGAIVHCSTIGHHCFVGHGAKVIGVNIPDGKAVPAGALIATPEDVAMLEDTTEDRKEFNAEVVAVNMELAKGYKAIV